MKFLAMIAVGLVVVPTAYAARPADSVARPLVFVMAGQSNMLGEGGLVGAQAPNPAVQMLTPSGWTMAQYPFPSITDSAGGGPGLPFANYLIAHNAASSVRLISCAVGGSPMIDWVPSGPYFQSCAQQIQQVGHIDGVLYYQGETDAEQADTAAAWPARFEGFVAGMRQLQPRVPVVYAQIGPQPSTQLGIDTFPYWATEQADQASVHVKGVSMIHTSDLSDMWGDPYTVHLSTQSELTVGARFARAWLRSAG